jgi:imidazole glycerol-phosphate synthase subunit HisH
VIHVVDYGVCNLGSILNMCRRLGIPAAVAATPADIDGAERLILPGVGAFDSGMRNLEERGLVDALTRAAVERRIPVLGICLGMQLMARASSEGKRKGLAWIAAEVRHFTEIAPGPVPGLKFPHIGWNFVEAVRPHPVLAELEQPPRFYFVHSYCVDCRDGSQLARARHGPIAFTAMLASGNLLGAQFHPEKSHRFGMRLLGNFAAWRGETS